MSENLISGTRSSQCVFDCCHDAFTAPVKVLTVDPKEEKLVCRLSKYEAVYVEMCERMNCIYSNPKFRKKASELKRNDLYAAEIDSNWYRIQLQWFHRSDYRCCVYLIDVGRTTMVSLSSIFALENWLFSEPFNRRYGIEFKTPEKCWPALKSCGYRDCTDIRSGQEVLAYVFSETEPFLAFFKNGRDVKQSNEQKTTQNLPFTRRPRNLGKFLNQSSTQNSLNLSFSHSLDLSKLMSTKCRISSPAPKLRIPFHRTAVATEQQSEMDGPFRMPFLPKRLDLQKPLIADQSTPKPKSFGEKSSDSGRYSDSDADALLFTRSLRRSSQKTSLSSKSPLNTDTNSDVDSTITVNESQFEAKVLSVNSPYEIYLETSETRARMQSLNSIIGKLYLAFLKEVSPLCLKKGDHLLYASDNDVPRRVRVDNCSEDEITLIYIDTGEEKVIETGEKTSFYNLPYDLDVEVFSPVCLGPLKTAGEPSPSWDSTTSRIKLRDLCDKVVSARVVERENGFQEVVLFDADNRNLSKVFEVFTRSSPAFRRKASSEIKAL